MCKTGPHQTLFTIDLTGLLLSAFCLTTYLDNIYYACHMAFYSYAFFLIEDLCKTLTKKCMHTIRCVPQEKKCTYI